MKLTNLFIAAFLLQLFSAAGHPDIQRAKATDTARIIILTTNDMHARIDNFPKLAYLADSLRHQFKDVFLVSAGDNFTGNPVVDQYPDKGYPMIDLMNRLGYNISAIGNHEFDLGQENLNKRIEQATFPFISCNIDAKGATFKQPEPYIVLKTADGLRIAVLSIIQLGENGLPDSHPDKLKGIHFEEGIGKALTYKYLKQQSDVFIALTHLGIEKDPDLAKQMGELDLIIGGHSHTVMERPMMVNGVMITQAGSGLKFVGKIILLVADGKLVGRSFELINLNSIKGKDKIIQGLIDAYNSNPALNEVIATAAQTIEGEDALGSLMTDAITDRLAVDFAFQNNGGIRISELTAGNILLKDIYKLDPFGNMVVKFNMNASEIKSLIGSAYNREKTLDLQVSGMSYTLYVDSAKVLRDVVITDSFGQALDPAKEYTVGINSYMASSYRFDHRDAGVSLYTTTAQALIDFLKAKKTVNYPAVKRAIIEVVK
ncbi:MAG: bifunctional UDP-sugar hydrolase/5'-nucleotidase [Bacteroidota bacterium]